jgi:hypothetical protein
MAAPSVTALAKVRPLGSGASALQVSAAGSYYWASGA